MNSFGFALLAKILFICCITYPFLSQAEEGFEKLPLLESDSSPGILISPKNIDEWRDLIPEPLKALSQQPRLYLRAGRVDELSLRYEEEWYQPPKTAVIGSDGIFRPSGEIEARFLSVVSEASGELSADEGWAVLWNSRAAWWKRGFFRVAADLVQVEGEQVTSRGTLELQRFYPLRASAQYAQQLFREGVNLLSSDFRFSYLTFRLLGDSEDFLWERSPLQKDSRQIPALLREDPFFQLEVSLDDLLGWSGKLGDFTVESVSSGQELIPLHLGASGVYSPADEGCVQWQSSGRQESLWNFESGIYLGGYDWLPTRAYFVPRRVFTITLLSQNPYSEVGRAVVVVEADSFFPSYVSLYDKAGRPTKTFLNVGSPRKVSGKEERLPVMDYSIVIHQLSGGSSFIAYTSWEQCPPESSDLKSFTPAQFFALDDRLPGDASEQKEESEDS